MDVIYLFSPQLSVTQIIGEGIRELIHSEAEYKLQATLPPSAKVGMGCGIGMMCADGRFRIFEVADYAYDDAAMAITVSATDWAVRELLDVVVRDIRPTAMSAGMAVGQLIRETDWQVGRITAGQVASMRAYYQSLWSALVEAEGVYDCHIVPYYLFERGQIVGKRVDVLSTSAINRGRFVESGAGASGVVVSIEGTVKTAIYGRGMGVQIEGDGDTGTSYGRRLTFADVVWSTAHGDPVDKPKGQEWVGDDGLLAQYGRDGQHRYDVVVFDDETDAASLLTKTWAYLQKNAMPKVSASATIADMEAVPGYEHQAIRLWDMVTVRPKLYPYDIAAQIVGIERDYIQPARTRLTIGAAQRTSGGMYTKLSGQLEDYASKASVWDRANAFGVNGAMDVMNNQITSTVGHWYTDPETGALMFVAQDGTKAMRLNGAGWQIADGKVGEQWQWRTAATGRGIVADEITTGTLRAALVTILGNAHFYWDAANIICQDPGDTKRQLRFGQYDGEHYGLALTQDGGASWQTAIDFDGAAVASALKTDFIQIMNDLVKIVSGGRVDIQTNDFALKNADGRNLLAVTSADDAAGDPGGQIELGEDGFPVKFAPSFILPPENGGTGYNFGQTHRLSVPPMDAFGSDGDAAIYYNGASDRFGDILPSLGGAGTSTMFGVARTWNDQSVSGGYGQIGNNSPANGGMYGCWWSFRTPANVNLHGVTLRLRTCKIIGGQWYGWNVQNPVTIGLYASTASAAPLATAHLTPANTLAEQAVSLEPSARLAADTTYYIAIFDPADALNKSRGFVALSGVVIPGQTGTATEGMFVKSNGRWVSMLEGMKIRAGTVTAASAGTAITYDGFDDVPYIAACYATTARAWSGDSGAIKIYNKTRTGATIEIGGSYASREVDWIAVGR